MKLYLHEREADLIKIALHLERINMTQDQREMCDRVLDRMELCKQLQDSKRKSKAMGGSGK